MNNLEKYILNQTLGAHAADNLPAALEARAIGIVKDSVTIPTKAEVVAAINTEIEDGFNVLKGHVNPILVTLAEPIAESIVDNIVGNVYTAAAAAWEAPGVASTFQAAALESGVAQTIASPVAATPASKTGPTSDAIAKQQFDAINAIRAEKIGG